MLKVSPLDLFPPPQWMSRDRPPLAWRVARSMKISICCMLGERPLSTGMFVRSTPVVVNHDSRSGSSFVRVRT